MSITESESNFSNLENLSINELLNGINQEDQSVAISVQNALPQIEKALEIIVEKMQSGGRLFYIGAGTSGRLGILDASECPPTFGVGHDKIIGLIAGGDDAIRKAVEFAEDDKVQAWKDLQGYAITKQDFLIGIAASGTTPYVIGGLQIAKQHGISSACITCNPRSEVVEVSDFPIEVPVGPEFVTGSTRMKAGTAQKMVLNMISTTAMIQLGHVKGNRMVDMQLSNEKLVDRGTKMIMQELDIDYEGAKKLLLKHGSVRKAVESGGK
ncbi:N-acetylmuramic acid 6-phosphate etherase [Marivirga sericea]|uniref:N-acetylmuramic acid 6-phosphate etherase n=1 Tax=Marivirga sericea TaxID=1028 RepID=A0A1X7J3I4_9BACT|nr:N-acetylmuramic acid 6-phosphate etherase [Marivirga sericea]SMG22137.1 N-acetylmuramic acid 6-phosphate etherase [Marivirga sericea]